MWRLKMNENTSSPDRARANEIADEARRVIGRYREGDVLEHRHVKTLVRFVEMQLADPDPTTDATSPEPMSDERLKMMQILLSSQWPDGAYRSMAVEMWQECLDEIKRLRAVIAERDAEIARLRGWLRIIATADDSDDSWWYTGRAERALAGEAAPE